MKQAFDYRLAARQSLNENWLTAAGFTLVYMAISIVVSSILSKIHNSGSLIAVFLLLPMTWAYAVVWLDFFNTKKLEFGYLKTGYNSRIFTTMALQTIYTYLWSLLLIIPGIIKGYSYAMTPYLLKENENLKNNEAIELSMKMMDGHKMELFILDLTFIGWIILTILTFGLGSLWLSPYMYSARAHFYNDLKEEYAQLNPGTF